MKSTQLVAAGLLSAAIFLSSSAITLADKGGKGNHGSAPGASAASGPGIGGSHGNAGPGAPGAAGIHVPSMGHSEKGDGKSSSDTEQNSGGGELGQGILEIDGKKVRIETADGEKSFEIENDGAMRALKSHIGKKAILYSIDGKGVSSVGEPNELIRANVSSVDKDTLIVRMSDGQMRLVRLSAEAVRKMHVHVGSLLALQTDNDGRRVRVGDLDNVRSKRANKADFAKFDRNKSKAHKSKFGKDLADKDLSDIGGKGCGKSGKGRSNPAFANQMAKDAANDASGHNPPGLPHECVNPAGHTRGFCKQSQGGSACGSSAGGASDTDVAKADRDNGKSKARRSKTDNDNAGKDVAVGDVGKCGKSSKRGSNPAYANQMAKDAANDASGHNPPGLPHECVNPAGHTRGFCKQGSSASGCSGNFGADNDVASVPSNNNCVKGSSKSGRNNPAYANQMAKDAANDASGHNPPGLPHECVNPAGHTRGFCKSRGSESSGLCSQSVATAGNTPAVGQRPNGSPAAGAPAPGFHQPIKGSPVRPIVGGPAYTVPGAGVPVASSAPIGQVSPVAPTRAKRNGHHNHYLSPASSRVLGASTGPVAMGRPARPRTRVLGMSQVVGSTKPCIWRKSTVAAAVYHPHIVPTVYVAGGRPIHHKKCVPKR